MSKLERPIEKLSFTVDEAAASIGLGASTVWQMIKEGELVAFKLRGRTLIHREVLEAAVNRAAASGRQAA